MDFAQSNLYLVYCESYRSIDLPTESTVAGYFGMSELPEDFAAVVTFRMRTGSQNLVVKDIYSENEAKTDYALGPGDSLTLLITKADGFRYQVLNHSS